MKIVIASDWTGVYGGGYVYRREMRHGGDIYSVWIIPSFNVEGWLVVLRG
jgi:hypothetical protein